MGKLVCRIELSKEKGVVLTVENDDDGIGQTIVMDGTSITTTVEAAGESSTITQKPDGVAIKCKSFSLEAETISCTSTKNTLHKSGGDFELSSQGSLTAEAAVDIGIKGSNSVLEGTSVAEIKGVTLKLAGNGKTELKAPSLKIESAGQLDLSSAGIVNLKGSMVNISGLAKLG